MRPPCFFTIRHPRVYSASVDAAVIVPAQIAMDLLHVQPIDTFGRTKHEATRSHGNRKAASGGISPTIQHGVLNPNRMHPGKGVALGVALDRVALVA